jgi:hypothetical protein
MCPLFGQEVRLRSESDDRWAEPISADEMLPESVREIQKGVLSASSRSPQRICPWTSRAGRGIHADFTLTSSRVHTLIRH